ncbi:MAG: hypothetical protein FWF36_10355, partial [Propionibacteriaceae bacterium]|nr:hypothetical protein [Propionibacteriaceae bacterium]
MSGVSAWPVPVEQFSSDEALAFVRAVGEHGNRYLAGVSEAEVADLAAALGCHPLALAISVSAIDQGFTIRQWLRAFQATRGAQVLAGTAGISSGTLADVWLVTRDRMASQFDDPAILTRAAFVVALLGPGGHSGVLWDDEAVASWVSPDGLGRPAPGAAPTVLGLLRRHSVAPWDGTPWPDGPGDPYPVISVHQLTASAILETSWDELGDEQIKLIANRLLGVLFKLLIGIKPGEAEAAG